MRQKSIMALFGQTEISIVLRMWVYFRRLFLCVGGKGGEKGVFYHHAVAGIWGGTQKGLGGEYQTHVHPDQHLGQFHYWRLPFYSLCTST